MSKVLQFSVETRIDDFGYPATAEVAVLNGETYGQKHLIWYAGSPSTLFANAPNGSLLIDITNADTYVKNGSQGLNDGSWVQT